MTGDPASTSEVSSSLRRCGVYGERGTVDAISGLSTGMSPAGVWRVLFRAEPSAPAASAILKIPDHDPAGLHPHDRDLLTREWAFHRSELPARLLGAGVAVPALLGSEEAGGKHWLWFEDVAPADGSGGEESGGADIPDELLRVVSKQMASLHEVYSADPGLAALPWLGRREVLRYERHVPAAEEALDRLASTAQAKILEPAQVVRLRSCLGAFPRAAAVLEQLPVTFAHGDYHIRNVIATADGLATIDWAHCGLAPVGTDAASFAELYPVFARKSPDPQRLGDAVLESYVEMLERVDASRSWLPVCRRAWGLWLVLRGLPIRLGHVLPALLEDRVPADLVEPVIADIQSGCDRAIRFVEDELSG